MASPSAAWAWSSALNRANSSRQGMHQEAQKFTTTGRPRRVAKSKVPPSRVGP